MAFDPEIFDRGLFDLGRRARAGVGLVRSEWRSRRETPLGLAVRLACVRRGFSSRSAALYGLDGPPDPALYVSDWHEGALAKRPNRRHGATFDDKLLFYYAMRSLTPHVTPVLGFTRRGRFVPVDEPDGGRPLATFLREVGRPVVLKPNFGTHGDGVVFVEPDGQDVRLRGVSGVTSTTPEDLARRIERSEYLVAQLVRQAAYARAIFPDSTNTIRVMTMVDVDTGRPFVPMCVHRFGTSRTAPIDTFAKGGVLAEIDLESGTLGPLVAPPERGRRVTLEAHPDTGARVTGRQVPRWRDLFEHMLGVADRLLFLPYVGWDVIVTDEGFLINEGNVQPSLKLLQACRPILADPRVARFFRHHGVIAARPAG
jgi:Sugar-transfer associated ATP-grasp